MALKFPLTFIHIWNLIWFSQFCQWQSGFCQELLPSEYWWRGCQGFFFLHIWTLLSKLRSCLTKGISIISFRLLLNYLLWKQYKGAPKLWHFKRMCFVMLVVCSLISSKGYLSLLYWFHCTWKWSSQPQTFCLMIYYRWQWCSTWY